MQQKSEAVKLRRRLFATFKMHLDEEQAERQVDAIFRNSQLDNIKAWLAANDKKERYMKKYGHLIPEARKYIKGETYISSKLKPMAMALGVGPTACRWLVGQLACEGLLRGVIKSTPHKRSIVGWNVVNSSTGANEEE